MLFVNDTLFTKHAAACILGRVLGADELLRQLRVPAICGKLDPYRSICLRNPWSGHEAYISTFCFLLNSTAQPALRQLREHAHSDGVFATADVADATWGQTMPAIFREYIRAHLSYAGSPYLWPQAANGDTLLLHKKACCVYFEGRLSGSIADGGAMVAINAGPRAQADIAMHELAARAGRSLTSRFRR